MATFVSPPVQPVLGQRVQVPYPAQASQLGFALVANSTSWGLAVDQGGPLGQLPAFTANVYQVRAIGSPIGFTASGSALAAGDGISVTWSDTPPPGSWPSSLTSQAVSVLGSVLTNPPPATPLFFGSAHPAGFIDRQTGYAPAGTVALLIASVSGVAQPVGTFTKVKVTQGSAPILFVGELLGLGAPLVVPLPINYGGTVQPGQWNVTTIPPAGGPGDTIYVWGLSELVSLDPSGMVEHSYGTGLAAAFAGSIIAGLAVDGTQSQLMVKSVSVSSGASSSCSLTGPDGALFYNHVIGTSLAPVVTFSPPLRLNNNAAAGISATIGGAGCFVNLAYYYR